VSEDFVQSVRAWRPASAGGLFLVGRTRHYAVEPAGSWVVGAITSGVMFARSSGRRLPFKTGDICVWPGDAAHTGESQDGRGWAARLVIMDPQLGAHLPRSVPSRVREGRLFRSFLDLHQSSELAADETESALVEWLCDLLGPSAATSAGHTPSRAVQLARELLDDGIGQRLSLDRLAEAAASDKFQLARMFKRELGVAPHRYLIGRRIDRARRLLLAGMPIAETAVATGFHDQAHFTRHFKGMTGVLPGRYRSGR
jgi:AraC-like DNA-binding protein